jgi:hypothetical protein
VLVAVERQRLHEQVMGIGLFEVGPPILLRACRWAALHHHAVTALVEHLRHRGVHLPAVGGGEERDADIAGRVVGRVSEQPPGNATSLVVQGGVDVPRSGGFILDGPGPAVTGLWPVLGVPGLAAHDLDRDTMSQGSRLKHVVEIDAHGHVGLGTPGARAVQNALPSIRGLWLLQEVEFLWKGADDDLAAVLIGQPFKFGAPHLDRGGYCLRGLSA